MKKTKNFKLVIASFLAIAIACGVGFSDRLFKSNAAADLKELSTLKNATEVSGSTVLPAEYSFYPDIQKKSDGTQITKASAFGNWDYTNADTIADGTEQPVKGVANIVWIDKDNTSLDGKIGMYYDNVGTYNGKTVALRATYMGTSKNATSNGFALIMYNNKLGIRTSLSHDSVTIKYEFLDAETGKAMDVKGYQQFADLDSHQGIKLNNYDQIYYANAALDKLKVVNYDGIGETIQSTISSNLVDDPTNMAKIAYTFSGSEISYTWTSSIRYYRDVEGKNATVAKAYKNLDKEDSILQALSTYYYVDADGNICDSDTAGAKRRSAVLTLFASSDKIIPSEMKVPLKVVSDVNGDEIVKDTYASNEQFYFTIIHDVPGETVNNYYTSYQLSDAVDSILTINGVKVLDGGTKEDVTYKFDVNTENNLVVATAKAEYLGQADFYAKSYELVMDVKLKEDADLTGYTQDEVATIPNKATVSIDNQSKDSNEVQVKIKDTPALNIVKTSDKTNYELGETATYVVRATQLVKNTTSKNVVISDTIADENVELLPDTIKVEDKNGNVLNDVQITSDSHSYTINTNRNLGYNEFFTVSYKVKLENENLGGKEVVNTAKAKADNADEVSETNTINIAVPVVYTPNLAIEKTVNKKSISVGDDVTYSIKVSQTEENATAKNLVISDSFDTTLTAMPAAKDIKVKDMDGKEIKGAKVSVQDTHFTVETGKDLGKDEFLTVEYTAIFDNNGLNGTILTNTAIAKADNAAQVSASATVEFIIPELAIEKTVDKNVIAIGDKVKYTLKVSQIKENATARNIFITDAFNTDMMTYPSEKNIKVKDMNGKTLTDAEVVVNGSTLNIETNTDLLYNEFITVEYTVIVDSKELADANVVNTAKSKATNADEVSAEATISFVKPELTIEKTADKQVLSLGDKVKYTIKVMQTVDGAIAKNVVITDAFDTDLVSHPNTITVKDSTGKEINADVNVDGKNLTVNTHAYLAKDEFLTIEYTVKIDDARLIDATIVNTAVAKADNAEAVEAKANVGTITPVLAIEKTVDKNQASFGDTATYTLKVSQTVENAVAKNVVITDTFDHDLTAKDVVVKDKNGKELKNAVIKVDGKTFTIETKANLAKDEFFTVTYQAVVNQVEDTITNTAVAKADNANEVSANATIQTVKPILTIEKTVDKDQVALGDTATYTLKVSQTVENAVAKNVVITDTFDHELTAKNVVIKDMNDKELKNAVVKVDGNTFAIETKANLAKDEFFTVTYKAVVDNIEGTITNMAIAKADNADNVEATANITPVKPELSIEKTVDKEIASIGDEVSYTLKIMQVSAGVSKNVVITDAMDHDNLTAKDIVVKDKDDKELKDAVIDVNGTTFTIETKANLTKDEFFTVTYKVVMTGVSSVENVATVKADNTDEKTTTKTIESVQPYLAIEKSVDKQQFSLGDTATYTLKVSQTDDGVAKNVVVSDTFDHDNLKARDVVVKDMNGEEIKDATVKVDGETFTVNTKTDLAKGEFLTIEYKAKMTEEGIVVNTAKAKADNADEVVANATVETVKPILTIEKAVDKQVFEVGETATYAIKVSQTANAVAKDVEISDIMDADLAHKDIAIKDMNGNDLENAEITAKDSGLVVKTNANLAKDEFFTITYTTTISDEKLVGKDIQNTATAKATNADEVSANAVIKVVKPVLTVEKASDKDVYEIGETATYTVKVMQTAENAIAKNVVISDTMTNAENIVVKDMNENELGFVVSKTDNNISIVTDVNLAKDEYITVSYTVALTDEALVNKDLTNKVSAKADNADKVDTEKTIKVVKPNLEITKEADKKYYSVGERATYKITVKQTVENAIARNVVITDTIDKNIPLEDITVMNQDGTVIGDATVETTDNGIVIHTNSNLAKDEFLTVSYTFLATKDFVGDVSNAAIATAENTDEVKADTTVSIVEPKLEATKTSEKIFYSLGDTITYNVKVSQTEENAVAKDVVITDTFDNNLITMPSEIVITDKDGNALTNAQVEITDNGYVIHTNANLAKDEFFNVLYSVVAANPELAEKTVTNTVVATSENTEPATSNATVNIEKPQLVVEKTSDKKAYRTDEEATYTVKITQSGKNSVARNIVLNDILNTSGATIMKDTIKVFDKDGNELTDVEVLAENQGYVINTHKDLATDEFLTITYKVDLKHDELAGLTITNTAKATSDNTEEASAKNEINIVKPELKVEKTSDQPIYLIGSTAKYTVKVSQTTKDAIAKNVVITDALSSQVAKFLPDTVKVLDKDGKEMKDVEISKSTNGYILNTHTDLAYNESITITYSVEMKDKALVGKTVENIANAKADNVKLVSTSHKVKVSDNEKEVQEELKKAGIDPVQTGDQAPIIPIALVSVVSLLAILVVLKRRHH